MSPPVLSLIQIIFLISLDIHPHRIITLNTVWRIIYVLRNRRKDKLIANDGLTPEERIKEGKRLGEADATDFENPYVRFHLLVV